MICLFLHCDESCVLSACCSVRSFGYTNSCCVRRLAGRHSRSQQPVSSAQQNLKAPSLNTSMRQPAPLNSLEPSVYGIFGNGAEYFALIHWQQVQGVFGSGDHLGNGYYVKEITASSVLLCPDRNRCSTNSITLTFH